MELRKEAKLLTMLSYKRPHESDTESDFVNKYIITPYGARAELLGPMRNVVITVGEGSTTLFSCHTDTVHYKSGFQEVQFDANIGHAYKNDGECLGADNTTGVWLMLEMIDAGVPGTYVFHRGEERGGIGSTWIANNKKDWLRRFKRAVAFDRKGEDSVISSQRGRACCSQDFAKALAAKLGPEWKPDPTGTFTDTANYTTLIPECTNLSIGYYDQHTKDEMQNIDFALALRDLIISIDWESLPTVREAKEEPWSRPYGGHAGFMHGFPHGCGKDDKDDAEDWGRSAFDDWKKRNNFKVVPPTNQPKKTADELFEDEYDNWSESDLVTLPLSEISKACKHDPVFAAVKIVELADAVQLKRTNCKELAEMVVEMELEVEDLNDRLTELQKEHDELRQQHEALGRKRQLNLPFFGRSQKGFRR